MKGRGFESLQERRENFLLQGRLSVLTVISVSVPPPVLRQEHVKDPGHSAKSAGGRLQLNTHTPYVCGFAWLYGVHRTCAETAAVSCGTTSVDIQKTRYKKLVTHVEPHANAVSLLKRSENSASCYQE